MLNNPTFWELVFAALVAVFAAPFLYLLYIAFCIARDALKQRALRGLPLVSLRDPVFGKIQYSPQMGCWEGEVQIAAVESRVSITIDATEDGPTEVQRLLFKQIERKYDDLFPAIRDALTAYVQNDWEFEICEIVINKEDDPEDWAAEYNALTDEDGDMFYSVYFVGWDINDIMDAD